jgi:hypothetical protein
VQAEVNPVRKKGSVKTEGLGLLWKRPLDPIFPHSDIPPRCVLFYEDDEGI